MTTLNPTQEAVLVYAIDINEGRVEWFPPQVKGGAQAKVLAGLTTRGLIDADKMVTLAAYEALNRPAPGTPEAETEPPLTEDGTPLEEEPREELPAPPAEINIDPLPPADEGCSPEIQAALAVLGFRDHLMTWARLASPEAIQAALPRLQAVLTGGKSKAPRAAAPRTPRPAGEAKPAREGTKQARAIAMLERPDGASNAEMQAEFGWQEHTVRGFIAGKVRKDLGLHCTATKEGERGLVYRIVEATPAPVEAPAQATEAPVEQGAPEAQAEAPAEEPADDNEPAEAEATEPATAE